MELNDFDGLRPRTPGLREDHNQWRQTLRDFVDKHIAPHIEAWSDAGTFPDSLYEDAARNGLLGFGFPQELGGWSTDVDLYHRIIFAEELHRLGSGVVFADLATHWIGLPPVVDHGAAELRETVVRPILAGRQRIAFAVTEPGGGSDVSAFTTAATPDGNDYLLSGAKTLISGALRANWLLVVAKVPGADKGGLTLFIVDAGAAGVSMSPVPGLSWYSASNGTIELDNVRVSSTMRIGEVGQAFRCLTKQFNIERFSGVASTLALARVATADAIAWAQEREAFGKRLVGHQSLRHRLVSMVREIHAAYAYMDQCVWRFENGEVPIADLCMLKIHATGVLERCAQSAVHVLAGESYRGNWRVQRIHREAQIFTLGGGTEEVLSDLAARQMKF